MLIADRIDAINWIVYNGYSEDEALEKVANKGTSLEAIIQKAIRQLSHSSGRDLAGRIDVVRWNAIVDTSYLRSYAGIVETFQSNAQFKAKVLGFVDAYAAHRNRVIVDDERLSLANYILSELPTLVNGVRYNEQIFDLILYPTIRESGMSQFVLDLRAGKYGSSDRFFLSKHSEPIPAMIEVAARQNELAELQQS